MSKALIAILMTTGFLTAQDNLVGTWKLVSIKTSTGANSPVYGANPTGFLTYTKEGRVHAILGAGDRKRLSTGDRTAATVEERAAAFSSFTAYAGRYTFEGDNVIHHVEIASIPNWVGTDLVRFVTLQGDRITLRTPPTVTSGVSQSLEL